jgi:Putative N-acetylmannosamine-6-phosphate epimerase
MRDPLVMSAVALAAIAGGAVGIRAQGLDDLNAMRPRVDVPLIGLVKVGDDEVVITPTVADCEAVAATGCEVVALDGTTRRRPDGSSVKDCIDAIHAAGALAMADCGSLEDAVASLEAGADLLGTTLGGYTGSRTPTAGPDLDLLRQILEVSDRPVLAEGRVRTPLDALRCIDLGAHAVVVGTAITHPTRITRAFVDLLESRAGR